ncbi:hypothetical protein [Microtetraspora niveoalba]|uniref:hypothetical protein n=1 Tax=Microtetraspora niveoalba TaxID=46175 RepID=UPI000AD414E6|nr:hypothetical protein [Microtetraspora niveoalba]
MFAFLLGLSWLVLTPICIWRLFGREQSRPARVSGVVTLAMLEAATLTVAWAEQPPHDTDGRSVAGASAHVAAHAPTPSTSTPSAAPSPACPTRTPAPESVQPARRSRDGVRGLTIYWTAAPQQCRTATVTFRRTGRKVRIWLDEGAVHGADVQGRESRTLPVRVAEGRAALDLTLMPPLRPGARYVAVDGRTGDRIPEKRRPNK